MAAAAAGGSAEQRTALLGDAGEQESWSHALDVEPPPAEGPSVQVPVWCSMQWWAVGRRSGSGEATSAASTARRRAVQLPLTPHLQACWCYQPSMPLASTGVGAGVTRAGDPDAAARGHAARGRLLPAGASMRAGLCYPLPAPPS